MSDVLEVRVLLNGHVVQTDLLPIRPSAELATQFAPGLAVRTDSEAMAILYGWEFKPIVKLIDLDDPDASDKLVGGKVWPGTPWVFQRPGARRHLLLEHWYTVCGKHFRGSAVAVDAFPSEPDDCKMCAAWVARHGMPRYSWD